MSILDTSHWADEFMDRKDTLLQLKVESIDAETDALEKKNGIQTETINVKGFERLILRWSKKNETEADEVEACVGEKVTF